MKKVVDWPEGGKPLNFWELTDPVIDLVRQAYFLDPNLTAVREGLDWKGPSLPEDMSATCFPFDKAVSAENLRYDDEEQGRDPLTVIIGVAVQLGIEQGRRMASENNRERVMLKDIQEVLRNFRHNMRTLE